MYLERDENDDDIEVAHRTATRSRCTRSIASGYVRTMHTAVVVLGREARPRSIICSITSLEWQTLVKGYTMPEDTMQGHLVTPKFNYADYDVDGSARCHHLDFLKYRTATTFYRNLFIGDAYFTVRFFCRHYFFVSFCPFEQLQTLVFFHIYKYHYLRQK
jgi:hypothetical protein